METTSNSRIIWIIPLVLLMGSNSCALAHTDVTAKHARNLIDSTNDLVVVDVREPSEYCSTRGHIPGARNYPWRSGVLEARFAELPTNGPVLVVCASGGRSNQAANFLDSKGFSTVYDMLGGMSAWQWETAPCKYSGGSGTPDDPYHIGTAEDLITLGETPEDYDKHFILTADIDLDPNLPGRKVFDKAVIAPDTNDVKSGFQGSLFTGIFDGNGHTISRLTITGEGYLGLFGGLGEWNVNAEVRSLGLVDVSIAGWNYVGGLVGRSYHAAVVAQCYSTGSVNGDGYIGGLVGENDGVVTQCYSAGAVTGQNSDGGVGGLVGENHGTMIYCYSIGSVRCDCSDSSLRGGPTIGGLVGMNRMFVHWGIVTNCFWDIQTSGQAMSYGGTGKSTAEMQNASTFLTWGTCGNKGAWTIDDGGDYPRLWWQNMPGESIAVGTTLSEFLTGGGTEDSPYLIYTPDDLNLIGLFQCEWEKHFKLMADIDVSGFDGKDGRPSFNMIAPGRVGGLEELVFLGTPFTGLFNGNSRTISHLTIKTSGCGGLFGGLGTAGEVRNLGVVDVNIIGPDHDVGGLVGWNEGTVTGCYSIGVVSGNSDVGGVVGTNWYGNVIQCYSTGVVIGCSLVGGLVGFNKYGHIIRCYSTGPVSGESAVGGLVGLNRGDVTYCYSTGMVSGVDNVGGLVGVNESNVFQCYSTAPVSGKSFVGGLAGYNGGAVTRCYSTGAVHGTGKHFGGLVGFRSLDVPDDPVTKSFWDTQTSGQAASAGGTGKITAEMQMTSTFLEAGWDFVDETANGIEDIWWILEGQDYPRLWWELIPEN